MAPGQFQRLVDQDRPEIQIFIDGEPFPARLGDTVLTAILTNRTDLGDGDFGIGPRAGFCLMGACQGCWVETGEGQRVRACGHLAADGMRIRIASESGP